MKKLTQRNMVILSHQYALVVMSHAKIFQSLASVSHRCCNEKIPSTVVRKAYLTGNLKKRKVVRSGEFDGNKVY